MFKDKEYPYMLANVDREVIGENAVLECKTTDKRNAEQWADDQVPANYILQCQWYLMVKGYEKAYIACLIGGNQFIFKEIERDEELIKMMRTAAVSFWENNVLADVEPDANYLDKTTFKHVELMDDAIELPDDLNMKVELLQEVKQSIKTLQTEEKQLTAEIKQEMEGHNQGLTSKYTIKWSQFTQKRVDSKKLKAENEDIFNQYTKESVSERLTVKEVI